MKKTSFLIKIISLLLAVSFLRPYEHKFEHLFTHHKDDVCFGIFKKPHLHEVNKTCDFYKFKIFIPHSIPPVFNIGLFSPIKKQLKSASQYYFLSSYQQLHFSLRGPPTRALA